MYRFVYVWEKIICSKLERRKEAPMPAMMAKAGRNSRNWRIEPVRSTHWRLARRSGIKNQKSTSHSSFFSDLTRPVKIANNPTAKRKSKSGGVMETTLKIAVALNPKGSGKGKGTSMRGSLAAMVV